MDIANGFYYGTSPNKFFDYLSLGLPIINNYPGWVSDIIKAENCGIAVEPNNPTALANSLIKLKDDIKMRNQMSINSYRIAKNQFDINKIAEDFVGAMESVIA